MDGRQRREFLESLSDFTLYETFYEAGTMLGGTLVALEDRAEEGNDSAGFRKWRTENLRLQRDRSEAPSHDRERQIRLIEQWTDRREELESLLGR